MFASISHILTHIYTCSRRAQNTSYTWRWLHRISRRNHTIFTAPSSQSLVERILHGHSLQLRVTSKLTLPSHTHIGKRTYLLCRRNVIHSTTHSLLATVGGCGAADTVLCAADAVCGGSFRIRHSSQHSSQHSKPDFRFFLFLFCRLPRSTSAE